MKLSVKLILAFALLALIPMMLLGYIAYNNGRQSILKDMFQHLATVNTLRGAEFSRWIDNNKQSLRELARRPLIREYAASLSLQYQTEPGYEVTQRLILDDHFFPILEEEGGFRNLFVLRVSDGKILVSTDEEQEGQYKENRPYFIMGKDRTYVQNVYFPLNLEEPAIAISTPVNDNEGHLIAVLAGHVNLGEMTRIMATGSSPESRERSEESYLVNSFNFFITEPMLGGKFILKKSIHTEGVEAGLAYNNGVKLYDDYRGVPVIGAYQWMPEFDAVIITEIDQVTAFATINSLRNNIALVAGLLLVFAIGLAVLLARQITDPLHKLAEYAGRVGNGEYTAEVEIKGRDEVARVTSDVRMMVGQLRQMQEKLLTSERLATLGQFSGSISHELRNPLGVIDSSVYYLKTTLKDADKKTWEHLDRIRSSVGSATAIIESLLSLTQMKEPQLRRLDLIAITSAAIASAEMPTTVNVIQDFPEEEVLVNADAEQFNMAFKNIVNNAVEAMDGRGTLTATVHTTADGRAEVSLADTGPGIAAENLNRVFQPLFSTKAKGIGFGLSIARLVIDRHGGTIAAKSEPGKGANIIIRLPLYRERG